MPFPVISRCMRQLNIIREALKTWPSESTESRLQPSLLDSRVFPLLREHAMLPIRQKDGCMDAQIDISMFLLLKFPSARSFFHGFNANFYYPTCGYLLWRYACSKVNKFTAGP